MLKTTVVLAAGLIVGGGIVQGLHAQMKPPAYQIALIDIKDEAGYKAASATFANTLKPLAVNSSSLLELAVTHLAGSRARSIVSCLRVL